MDEGADATGDLDECVQETEPLGDRSLPVIDTLRTAVREIQRGRSALLRALLAPACIVAVVAGTFQLVVVAKADAFSFALVQLVVFLGAPALAMATTLVAVSSHRIVLLGETSLAGHCGLYWSMREIRFWLRAALLALLTVVPGIALGMTAERHLGAGWRQLVTLVLRLALAYPVARLSLILPATAIGERLSFAHSWDVSRGNGWRLTAVLAPGPFLLEGMGWVLDGIPGQVALSAAGAFVCCFLGIFEVVSLSVSYRALLGERRPSDRRWHLRSA